MDTTPHWLKSADLPRFPRLDHTVTVDVAIVGAGITGITAAYLLKKAGLTVALIERGRFACVDTGHTTAHLTAVTDLRLHQLEHQFGPEDARKVWEGGMAAIARIESLIAAEQIACGFRACPAYLHAARPNEDPAELEHEVEVAHRLGIDAEFVPAAPFFQVPGVMFQHQAIFNPIEYLTALIRRIPGGGSHVFEETDAQEIEKSPRCLRSAHGQVNFTHLVLTTHNPLMGITGLLRATLFQTKLSLYTSYALGARLAPDLIPDGCYWDTADPYHYLRVETTGHESYAIYGGGDHKTGQIADTIGVYDQLAASLRRFAPDAEIDSRWSGQVIETHDGLPYIGESAEYQFIATGFSGNGMTFGTLGAMMAVDAIHGRANPWKKLFDPHRTTVLGATWSYLKENKDFPYFLVKNWLAAPEIDSLRELERGEGRIVRLGHRKVAAYRNSRGRVILCSPVCTHLQCIVGWNTAEKTWDCPCHGSRFHPDGRVLSGPAEEPLPQRSRW